MVSQANATRGSKSAIAYIQNDKGQALELDRNLIGEQKPHEILAEFREVQSLRPNVKNNTYSIYLSPDNEQKQFSIDELRELGKEHLKNLGLDKHQYLMTLHTSTGKPHIHFQVNRISIDGQTHNDSFISKKAQTSAEQLAQSRGLKTAKEIQAENKQQTKEERAEIYKAYNQSSYRATSFEEFEKNMQDKGYTIELTKNKQGKIQGFNILLNDKKKKYKASEIHRNVRFNKLTSKLDNNRDNKLQKEAWDKQQDQERKQIQEQRESRNRGFSFGR